MIKVERKTLVVIIHLVTRGQGSKVTHHIFKPENEAISITILYQTTSICCYYSNSMCY